MGPTLSTRRSRAAARAEMRALQLNGHLPFPTFLIALIAAASATSAFVTLLSA